jgi:RNA polymerase sigma-70 factor (ECF subfamily)
MAEDNPPLAILEERDEKATTSAPEKAAAHDASPVRLRRLVDKHFDFVWRVVRFLGVPELAAEDAAQQVFCVVARKLGNIAVGSEISFLFSTASRVASEARRAARSRPVASDQDVDALQSEVPGPDELVDRRRARDALQAVLDSMPLELRVVFVLFEIEELTLPEIAAMTGIPLGTATSRLRRAREEFEGALKRRRAAEKHSAARGGRP